MNFKNSKFIVLEGIDGSGKTQACKLIAKILKKHNIKYCINHFVKKKLSKNKIQNLSEILFRTRSKITCDY